MSTENNNGYSHNGHSHRWLFIAMAVTFLVGGFLMHLLGLGAVDMSPDAKELNELVHEKNIVCSQPVDLKKCSEVVDALKKFQEERGVKPELP